MCCSLMELGFLKQILFIYLINYIMSEIDIEAHFYHKNIKK